MSVKIVAKSLPNGVVPYDDVTDAIVKKKVMLLNQNISLLAAQLAELQRAVIELQGRPMPKQKEIEDIERYVAQAAASAESAAGSATSAGQSASTAGVAATNAGNSAIAAENSETNAGNSASVANSAKTAAESARDEAVPAAQTAAEKADEAVDAAERAEAAAAIAQVEGYVIFRYFESSYSISGSSAGSVVFDGIGVSGYSPVAIFAVSTGLSAALMYGYSFSESGGVVSATVNIRNTNSTSSSNRTFKCSVMYLRNGIKQTI